MTGGRYERFTIADALREARCVRAYGYAFPVWATIRHMQHCMGECRYRSGENAVTEGKEGDMFFIIEAGEFAVTKSGVHGEVSKRLTRGDYFGERALIMDEVRRGARVYVCVGHARARWDRRVSLARVCLGERRSARLR